MDEIKIVAELVIVPHGVGVSLSKYVKEAVKVIDGFPGIRVMHTPMGTIIETDSISKIFEVTKIAHERMFEIGVERVSTTIRIDDRRDKARRMEDKVDSIVGD